MTESQGENSSSDQQQLTTRLRRCRSTSKAETIVTEDLKIRRSQPDKPIHKPCDSLFSWSSGFQNFEGMGNWALLLLTMGGIRLCLENLNKYGIRVDPQAWFQSLMGDFSTENNEYPTLFIMICSNVPVLISLAVEKLLSNRVISQRLGRSLIILNLITILLIPIVIVNFKYELIGPLKSTFICTFYTIIFLKLWSYHHVNYWCRKTVGKTGQAANITRGRQSSLIDASAPPIVGASRITRNNLSPSDMVFYPENLTFRDIYYFWFAPTLCYELNFPRSNRTRTSFLFRRLLEVIVGTNFVIALIQQWIIPSVVNSLIPFSTMSWSHATERILKLAVPNHLIWLAWFYLLFHSFLNTVGEILRFSDRNFYSDWWNANNVVEFWKTWNLPVHKWCVRHVYKPLVGELGYHRITAMLVVFFVSAILHEYCVSVPLRMFKIYAFLGMVLQMPIMYLSVKIQEIWSPRLGNVMVWMSLIIGQPMAVMMYYHDFVVEHYGQELLETYGKLNN